MGVTAAATSSANNRVRCLLGASIVSPSEDSPPSTSDTDFMNATRFEDIFCSAPSNAESFRFKADLLGDFETERDTDELLRWGLEGVGFAEDIGVRFFERACRSRRIWVLICERAAVIVLIRSSKVSLGNSNSSLTVSGSIRRDLRGVIWESEPKRGHCDTSRINVPWRFHRPKQTPRI
jgi:hypothetical protein